MATVGANQPVFARRPPPSRALGSFVARLTQKSFEKYGFSTAALLTDWPAIAGRELASFTLPERLKWPRNVDAYSETSDAGKGRPGATLILRVDGPRAIEVQYQSAQIAERINAYFGYRAVSEIRFIQAPLPEPAGSVRGIASSPATAKPRQPPPAAVVRTKRADAPDDANEALLAALTRLERNVCGSAKQK